jgi:predicted outer membrane repeat protein
MLPCCALQVGGALMLHRGRNRLVGATFTGNIAAAATGTAAATAPASIYYKLGEVPTSAGGAVYAWMGSLTMTECTVSSNAAWGTSGRGGGIFVHGAALQLTDSVFEGNFASSAGGAVLLGPSGAQVLKVSGSNFTGNAARQYGGAVAAGLLLPGDAAAANTQAMQGEPLSSWSLQLSDTQFASNAAGKQGGAVACSLCDGVSIAGSSFASNAAVQTGGGISCISCSNYTTAGCSFSSNLAASGAGACILAAGNGSTTSDNVFSSNVAGRDAAADALARVNAAAAAAGQLAASHHGASAANGAAMAASLASPMLSPRETLPACGVVGTGGGLCLGLWDAGFKLLGPNRFANNTALYGAGLFVEACPNGAEECPFTLDVGRLVFTGNALSDGGTAGAGVSQRHLLQAQGNSTAAAAAAVGDGSTVLGSGANLYATNATVLVMGSSALPAPATAQAAAAKAAAAAVKSAQAGRHLLQNTTAADTKKQTGAARPAGNALAVAQQLAGAVTAPVRSGNGTTPPSASAVATGPSQLGQVQLTSSKFISSSSKRVAAQDFDGIVADSGRMGGVRLNVLDQLGSQVSSNVAEQLSVVAELSNCTTCMVAGISKVQPSNGAAAFEGMQLLAPPGTNQSLTFTLLNATGAKLGNVATVRVRLPTCSWGQAKKIDGCSSCAYPLFTWSNPQHSNCSICPGNTRNCSGTTVLPDTGYWQSGPLSAHMIKCPRKAACRRWVRLVCMLLLLFCSDSCCTSQSFQPHHFISAAAPANHFNHTAAHPVARLMASSVVCSLSHKHPIVWCRRHAVLLSVCASACTSPRHSMLLSIVHPRLMAPVLLAFCSCHRRLQG